MSSTVSCSSAAAIGLRAEAEVGEDLRDRDRVRDVRLAALALLPVVRLLGGRVGALDDREIGLRVVRPHRPEQRVDGTGRLRAREDARDRTAQRSEADDVLRFRHGGRLPPILVDRLGTSGGPVSVIGASSAAKRSTRDARRQRRAFVAPRSRLRVSVVASCF